MTESEWIAELIKENVCNRVEEIHFFLLSRIQKGAQRLNTQRNQRIAKAL